MKKRLNDAELFSCRFTSDLFEYSTKIKDCSSKIFIKAFIYSNTSKIISNKAFIYDSKDVSLIYELLKKEKKLTRGKDIYPSFVMSWIGYILEYFTLSTNIPLTIFYKKIKPEELYKLYESYHSLDNDLVVKRILESTNINTDLNNVLLLKKIYNGFSK